MSIIVILKKFILLLLYFYRKYFSICKLTIYIELKTSTFYYYYYFLIFYFIFYNKFRDPLFKSYFVWYLQYGKWYVRNTILWVNPILRRTACKYVLCESRFWPSDHCDRSRLNDHDRSLFQLSHWTSRLVDYGAL